MSAKKGTSILIPPPSTEPWWTRLTPDEQQTVGAEVRALGAEMIRFGHSRLAIGRHLLNLQTVLEPKGLFTPFLREWFRQGISTAYRYMDQTRALEAVSSPRVVDIAVAHGIERISADALKAAPKTNDEATILRYLKAAEDEHRQSHRRVTAVDSDPEVMLKECWKFIHSRLAKLPANATTRGKWARKLMGMVLADLGVMEGEEIKTLPIPEEFRIGRGRPKKVG